MKEGCCQGLSLMRLVLLIMCKCHLVLLQCDKVYASACTAIQQCVHVHVKNNKILLTKYVLVHNVVQPYSCAVW
jgi:hypothetical protein